MDTTYKLTTLHRQETTHTPDCIQFCPIDDYKHYVAIGAYQLNEKTNTKTGFISISKLNLNDELHPLLLINKVVNKGVLDLKWHSTKVNGRPLLGSVQSSGIFEIHSFFPDNLVKLDTFQLSSTMLLYIAFTPVIQAQILAAISDADGYVYICNVVDKITLLNKIKPHSYEAWVTSFCKWNPDIFYSGSDDCLLNCSDIRLGSQVAWSKEHESGVTMINSWPHYENTLVTGSYDECVRIFDTRNLKTSLSKFKIGGGVWRIQEHPTKSNLFLAACMYEGFKLCSLEDNNVKLLANYGEHGSIAYGIDWYLKDGYKNAISISFYDCAIHVWRIEEIRGA